MVRMQRSVSGTWAEARATAARFCSCAFSIRFCTTRVKRYSSGKTTSRINASPRFSAKITARMPHRRQASANMLMMPEVNSSSTVSTSPTKRETAAPDSWFTKASAGSLSSLAHMALRRAWVILWPNTVSKLSRRESNPPESASSTLPSPTLARMSSMDLRMKSPIVQSPVAPQTSYRKLRSMA